MMNVVRPIYDYFWDNAVVFIKATPSIPNHPHDTRSWDNLNMSPNQD